MLLLLICCSFYCELLGPSISFGFSKVNPICHSFTQISPFLGHLHLEVLIGTKKTEIGFPKQRRKPHIDHPIKVTQVA